jgi:hypothetical protein
MLRDLTSPQLTELEAFWRHEGGWGDWKQDYRIGQLCSIHANINRDSKKRLQPYSPEDFAMRPSQERDSEEAQRGVKARLDMLAGKKAKSR